MEIYGCLSKLTVQIKSIVLNDSSQFKLPSNSENKPRGLYFSRPFLRGLFLEGLIFGGAYLRKEICVSKSIGLAL